ncbi:hypothetical protein LC724_21665 [Blautia sp. RD014234]|nr:hypothetical protein [Blautia parvula]
MDKITGQISGAQATVNKKETNVIISNGEYTEKESKNEDSSYLSVAEGEKGTMVDFYNQGNSHVTIKTKAFKDESPEEKNLLFTITRYVHMRKLTGNLTRKCIWDTV